MPNPISASAPAGYAPLAAFGFAQSDDSIAAVSNANPLPVTPAAAPPPPPLAGTATANAVVGPFPPLSGRPVILSLTGTWAGIVRVLRSTDGGTSKLPLTVAGSPWAVFNAPCCEPVWEEVSPGAELYLDITVSSGSVTYRIGQ